MSEGSDRGGDGRGFSMGIVEVPYRGGVSGKT